MELSTISKCLGHELDRPNTFIKKFLIDSREVTQDSCFFAIEGMRSDGHNFISDALSAGAKLVIGTKEQQNFSPQDYLLVDDINHAMFKLASQKRKDIKSRVVAVIGNVGKTTTKEYLKALLGQKHKVSANKGNQNGLLGVPLTILNVPVESDVLIIEIGIDRLGEMQGLSSVAKPHDVIVSNLGTEHLEGLGSEEQAVAEELLLVEDVLKSGGNCVLPMWNHWAESFARKHQEAYGSQIYSVWIDSEGNLAKTHNLHFKYRRKENSICLMPADEYAQVPQAGFHNGKNYALSIPYAYSQWQTSPPAELDFKVLAGRTQVVPGKNNSKLILDYYNAQEDSVSASLELLAEISLKEQRPSVCILGDMLDLGTQESQVHQNIARKICSLDIDYVFLCGSRTQAFILPHLKPFYVRKKLHWVENSSHLDRVLNDIPYGAAILLKGSRGMQMEQALPFLNKS